MGNYTFEYNDIIFMKRIYQTFYGLCSNKKDINFKLHSLDETILAPSANMFYSAAYQYRNLPGTKGRCNYGVAIFLLQVYPKTQRTAKKSFLVAKKSFPRV